MIPNPHQYLLDCLSLSNSVEVFFGFFLSLIGTGQNLFMQEVSMMSFEMLD